VTAPLLACDRPRLAGSDFELGQFEAVGPVLCLVGAWGPLFQLLSGERRLSGGKLQVLGLDAEGAARDNRVGLLLRDVPFPPAQTLQAVLRQSAALLGHDRRAGAEHAAEVARILGLEELLPKKLARLTPAQQRAGSIAAARLGNPSVLAIEEPFSGLEPSACAYLGGVLERAVQGRAALISMPEVPGSPQADRFAQASDELLFLSRHGLGARGSPLELLAGAASYRVVVLRHAALLLSRLVEAGYEARQVTSTEVSALIVVDIAGRGTLPLSRASLDADAPIIELVPLSRREH
jgi:ABC-type multidrug transport system ATPase subunit